MSLPPSNPDQFDFDRLTVSGASRVYGRRRALSRVSVSLHAGELVGLLGPNGAGKSTFLGLLSTLIAPSAGTVQYGERNAQTGGSALRRQIGFLSHELQLYPELTASENLCFFSRLYGLSDTESRVSVALSRARLDDRSHDLVLGFSRGMRQRLAVERALLHEPRLVLLDEPFTGLDERSCLELRERLFVLKESRRIVVIATHDLDLIEGLVDRTVTLSGGRLIDLADSGDSVRVRYREAIRRAQ